MEQELNRMEEKRDGVSGEVGAASADVTTVNCIKNSPACQWWMKFN